MSPLIHALHRHVTLIERVEWVRPAEDPFGIFGCTVHATMGTRHTEIVVPERGMDGIPIATEKRCPRNCRRIIASSRRATTHMDRKSLAPGCMLTEGRQIL